MLPAIAALLLFAQAPRVQTRPHGGPPPAGARMPADVAAYLAWLSRMDQQRYDPPAPPPVPGRPAQVRPHVMAPRPTTARPAAPTRDRRVILAEQAVAAIRAARQVPAECQRLHALYVGGIDADIRRQGLDPARVPFRQRADAVTRARAFYREATQEMGRICLRYGQQGLARELGNPRHD